MFIRVTCVTFTLMAMPVEVHCRDQFYWDYIGIMEKKMETIIMGFIGYTIWGIWGYYFVLQQLLANLRILSLYTNLET